jgi:hypothetical protein
MPPAPPTSLQRRQLWLIGALVLAAHSWVLHRWLGPLLPRSGSTLPAARLAVRLLPAPAPPTEQLTQATPPTAAPRAQRRRQTPTPTLPGTASAEVPAATSSPALSAQTPPRYAVDLPAPLSLNYRSRQGTQSGQVQLRWTHDGQHYELEQSWHSPGRPGHRWLSRGQLAPGGIAPERLLEQRQERAVQAVNFQRDKGILSYSASALSSALLEGTQDRASWLLQLAGIVHAQAPQLQPGERLSLLVASPRGQLDTWVFQLQPSTAEPTALLHWIREPQRPYDWRIELWLAPALHYLPQRLLWQLLPGGEPLVWELEPPAASP